MIDESSLDQDMNPPRSTPGKSSNVEAKKIYRRGEFEGMEVEDLLNNRVALSGALNDLNLLHQEKEQLENKLEGVERQLNEARDDANEARIALASIRLSPVLGNVMAITSLIASVILGIGINVITGNDPDIVDLVILLCGLALASMPIYTSKKVNKVLKERDASKP